MKTKICFVEAQKLDSAVKKIIALSILPLKFMQDMVCIISRGRNSPIKKDIKSRNFVLDRFIIISKYFVRKNKSLIKVTLVVVGALGLSFYYRPVIQNKIFSLYNYLSTLIGSRDSITSTSLIDRSTDLTSLIDDSTTSAGLMDLNRATEEMALPFLETAKSIKHRVIHLAQKHWRPELEGNKMKIGEIWAYQSKIADFLKQYPDAIVFSESFIDNIECSKSHQYPLHLFIHALFPNGVPNYLDEWTWHQKKSLAQYSATRVLCFLGKIKQVYRYTSPEEYKANQFKINKLLAEGTNMLSKELRKIILDKREASLAREVKTFLSRIKNPSTVFVTFGEGHDLSPYFSDVNFQRIEFAPPISWGGKLLIISFIKVYEAYIAIKKIRHSPVTIA